MLGPLACYRAPSKVKFRVSGKKLTEGGKWHILTGQAGGRLERLWETQIKYLLFDWLLHVTTYCFVPEILAHFHSIVPASLQATKG